MDNRIITTDVMEEDFSLEGNLRPQTLDEYIGCLLYTSDAADEL